MVDSGGQVSRVTQHDLEGIVSNTAHVQEDRASGQMESEEILVSTVADRSWSWLSQEKTGRVMRKNPCTW